MADDREDARQWLADVVETGRLDARAGTSAMLQASLGFLVATVWDRMEAAARAAAGR